MIKTKRLASLTGEHRAALCEYARTELTRMAKFSEHMLAMSDLWEIRDDDRLIGIYGFYLPSVVEAPRFWFMLCKDFQLIHVRAFRWFVDQYKVGREHVWTSVEEGFDAGHRFALACGFAPEDETFEVDGIKYVKYRAAP